MRPLPCLPRSAAFYRPIALCGLTTLLLLGSSGRRPACAQQTVSNPTTITPFRILKSAPSSAEKGRSLAFTAVAFSPDGKRMVAARSDKHVVVWDVQTGRELQSLPEFPTHINSLAFSPDGKRMAVGMGTYGNEAAAVVWDFVAGNQTLLLPVNSTTTDTITFSPDGKRILTADNTWIEFTHNVNADKNASVWDAESGREILVLKGHRSEVHSAVFSADGERILTSSMDGTANVCDTETGQLILTVKPSGYSNFISTAVFSPDGNFIVTGGGKYNGPGRTICWDAHSGKLLWTVEDKQSATYRVAFGPDGAWLVTSNENGAAVLRSARTGQEIAALKGPKIFSLSISTDGRHIVTGSGDTTVSLWQTPAHLLKAKPALPKMVRR